MIPAEQMRGVGLIGGTSWHSTVDYYRLINQAVNDTYGNNTNPPLVVYNLNQDHVHGLQRAGRWQNIAELLAGAAEKLRRAGAEAVLFCANTPHKVYAQVAAKSGVPILHIGDATGVAIQQAGLRRVGLIGTLYTMEDGFFQSWLKERYTIETIVPRAPTVRNELQRIIQKELGVGVFKPETKRYVLDQMEALRTHGAEGVILGCTEFPLIIQQADVPYPIFDTTRLHSAMAVDFILRREMAGTGGRKIGKIRDGVK